MISAARLSLVLLLLFFISMHSVAQQQYLFSHLHVRDGLASETVNAVQQDEKGFIWIATNNGLQRYDGSSFLTFQHKEGDKNSLTYSRVAWLKKDLHNRLWLILEDNKVGYFNTSDFSFHEVPIDAPEKDLHTKDGRLFTDSLGYVMFLLGNTNVYTYNEQHNKFSSAYNPFTLPKNWKPVWLSYNHKHNNYWIGCIEGLVKYNATKNTLSYQNHNTDNDSIINALSDLKVVMEPYVDQTERFWVTSWPTPKGLTITSYDAKTNTRQEWQQAIAALNNGIYFEVTTTYEQQNGDMWFMGPNLFAKFNKQKQGFDFIKDNLPGEFSLHYDGVNSITEDREHNVWVCSNLGLYRFNPQAQLFNTYFNKPFNKDTTFYADVSDFIQLKNGVFVVTTWGNGLFAYDSSFKSIKQDFIEQGNKLAEGMDWSILQRRNGDIWRGHQGGYLYIYHDSSHTSEILKPDIFNHSTVRQVVEDKNGNIWLGTHSGLVAEWKADSNKFVAMQKFNSPVHRLYIDKKNNVWACLRTDGVACLSSNDGSIIHRYTTSASSGKKLMVAGANDIVQYNDSIFLIASGTVNVLNIRNDSIRFINPKRKSYSNTVSSLAIDGEGTLWVGSGSGIFNINMQTEASSSYDESDGLQPFGVHEASSYVLPNGMIAFGRSHDFVLFDPYKIRANDLEPPPVTITNFFVMNKPLLVDSLTRQKSIEFSHDKNDITIQFSTLTYKNQYSIYYKLIGLDKEWILSTDNEAKYTYLPPGNYTFELFAQNANGLKSKKITSISFSIATPFYQSWWFFALLALLAITLLYWFDYARMKRRAAVQLMRSNISDNLHAEVNNALQDINMLSEIATIKAGNEPEQSKNYIGEINYKSRNMITAMDDMLWSIDPVNDTMEKFMTRAKEFAASASYSNNAIVIVRADKQAQLLKPDMQLRYELMMLYKISLSWLVNEMNALNVIVQLNYINHQLQLNMFAADITANAQQRELIKKRLEQKAESIISNTEILSDDKGTAVIVNIRL